MENLEKTVEAIQLRNARVEQDKAWERSWARRIFISSMTYIFAVVFLWSIQVEQPFLSALVPTVGFLLSTLSLPGIRKLWERNR